MARKKGRICLTGRLVKFFTENAIESGSMSLVVFEFLWSGLDERNLRDTHKRTPLSWAAKHGQTDTAKLLFDHRRG
jgi:ankyrin repeat protein